jgi:hypothetical protein
MDDLDRLGWAAGFSFRAHGARIGVRVNDPALLERLRRHLPPGAVESNDRIVDHLSSVRVAAGPQRRGVRAFHLAYSDITRISRSEDLDEVLDAVEGDLGLFVAAFARGKLFVHAGVVGWNGLAILLPGRSHTGKSTLTAALLRAGATYYSDEYAVLDPRGLVHPFPRPISLRRENGKPQRIAVGASNRPLRVGLVVSTRFRPKARRWKPRSMSPAEVVLALFENTVAAQRLGAKALTTLKQVSQSAVGLSGSRGDADRAAEEILACLDRFSPVEQHTPRRPS